MLFATHISNNPRRAPEEQFVGDAGCTTGYKHLNSVRMAPYECRVSLLIRARPTLGRIPCVSSECFVSRLRP
jgi:hypothetical protein